MSPNPSEEPSANPSVRSARGSGAADDADDGREHGRTDGQSPTITEEHRATARELAEHANLSRVDARRSQVRQVADALALALAHGYSAEQLRAHLRAKLAEARTVRYVLNALDPARLDDIQPHTPVPSVPPVCGQCDARDGDGVRERVVFMEDAEGKQRGQNWQKCPRCHPHATAAHSDR